MVSPSVQRSGVRHLMTSHEMSERHACELVGMARNSYRYQAKAMPEKQRLDQEMRQLAEQQPTYGYRPITALLRRAGHVVNHKRVHRLWKQAGLQLPRRKVVKRRYGKPTEPLKRATHPNHVWTYDFLETRTERGRRVRILAVLDEYTRYCLALFAAPSISSSKVLDLLGWLFQVHGKPEHLRSDNGPEFIAYALQFWLGDQNCDTLYITPGSPWENPFIESFNGKLRTECLNRHLFTSGAEVQNVLDHWRQEYNHYRPHSSLNYLAPAQFAQQVLAGNP